MSLGLDALQRRLAAAVLVGIFGLVGLVWWARRSRSRTLDDLIAVAPECAHDLARLLAAGHREQVVEGLRPAGRRRLPGPRLGRAAGLMR